MHPAALPHEELARACSVERTRRSGPGGQHRNKVETAIVITHTPSGVRGEGSERRSQAQNLEAAWRRLRVNLAVEVRTLWTSAAGVSPLWRERVQGGKIRVNPEHPDFGALLAEALDVLAALDWDAAEAARTLGVSTSQLVKFLKLEPRASQQLNREREARGLRPLV